MEKPVNAQVVHAIPGRVRIRIEDRIGDEPFFLALAQQLAKLDGVREARASARTASLLVLYTGQLEPILSAAQSSGLRVRRLHRSRTPMRDLKAAIDLSDLRLARATDGALNLGTLTAVGMLGAGIYQTQRGFFLPAGMALFKYALQAITSEAEREVSEPGVSG